MKRKILRALILFLSFLVMANAKDILPNSPYTEFATLKGVVWYDKNLNGIQDSADKNLLIKNVRVHLYKDGQDSGEMVTTNDHGEYIFENLEPNHKYAIKVDKPRNYTDFTYYKRGHNDDIDSDVRSNGFSDSVLLHAGEVYDKIDAGLVCRCVAWLHIEKLTNGVDADFSKGPLIKVGDEVEWKYIVSNPSRVKICNIKVTDDKEGNISCPKDCLAPLEEMTCIKRGIAKAGQYGNLGVVHGKCEDSNASGCANNGEITNDDPSHYYGIEPKIDIEKLTNEKDSDTAPGETLEVGSKVIWKYIVKNVGNVKLTNIIVQDDKEGVISCPKDTLEVGESMTCQKSGIVQEGDYENQATVSAKDPLGGDVQDSDTSHYHGKKMGACLGDFYWFDKNLNGVQDSNEPGVVGVKVELFDEAGHLLQTTHTNNEGKYLFCNLKAGRYKVKFDLPKTYLFVPKDRGEDDTKDSDANSNGWSHLVILKDGDIDLSVDAGIYCSCDEVEVTGKKRNLDAFSLESLIISLIILLLIALTIKPMDNKRKKE